MTEDVETRIAALAREATGLEVSRIEGLPGRLGPRAFYRVALADGTTLVARRESETAPAGLPPEPPLEPIRAFLEAQGLPVVQSVGRDAAAGIDLLEDLGACTLETAAARSDPDRRRALYTAACRIPPRLQALEPPSPSLPAFERRLDGRFLAHKCARVIEYALPWALGRRLRADEAELVRAAFTHIETVVERAPRRLSHRDFKAENLHLRPGGAAAELTLIDLQGAWLAPPEYDLVCLLRDSHVRLPDDEMRTLAETARPALPDAPEPDVFWHRFDLLTLARKGKDLGLYLFACREQGEERYLSFVPNDVHYLKTAAARLAPVAEPALQGLAELFNALPDRVPTPQELAPCGP
ncbi:MAG: phosphotransferase [Proteobacteria bacterium]|nr:phosphotransferase [Pseudomonadota bacterium]